ncbi:MAG: hypothetical protein ACRDLK_11600 [Gaiellaceae bacterium]
MPIIETSPRNAFEKFETHMGDMVRSVLPIPAGTTVAVKARNDAATLGFWRGGVPTSVPVETHLGRLYLSLSQDLIAIREGTKYRLRTQRYAYKLLPSDDARAEAIIRWEFKADTDEGRECRNHMHLNAAFPVGRGTFTLNRLHLPTAWVLIEHVLRFLFHDLQVPPQTPEWARILRESETAFYERFTSKRYGFRG